MTVDIRPVADDQWDVVAWLYQLFRHDVTAQVASMYPPYADGRYRHDRLDEYPAPDATGYLAWAPHPKDGAEAPAAFALVNRLGSGRNHLAAFYVLPYYRRGGLGRRLVRDVVGRHPGGWEIAFQHENEPAIRFWRSVATDLWGDAWVETEEPVPDVDVPPDHWIRTT